jgi:hypothetical protein
LPEEEREEKDLFVFNDTIEGPKVPAVKPGRVGVTQVEVTESSTNKKHTLSSLTRVRTAPLPLVVGQSEFARLGSLTTLLPVRNKVASHRPTHALLGLTPQGR